MDSLVLVPKEQHLTVRFELRFGIFCLLVMCLSGGDVVVRSFGEFVLTAGFLYPSSKQ